MPSCRVSVTSLQTVPSECPVTFISTSYGSSHHPLASPHQVSPEGHARQLFQANLGHPGEEERATLSRGVRLRVIEGLGTEKGLGTAGQEAGGWTGWRGGHPAC